MVACVFELRHRLLGTSVSSSRRGVTVSPRAHPECEDSRSGRSHQGLQGALNSPSMATAPGRSQQTQTISKRWGEGQDAAGAAQVGSAAVTNATAQGPQPPTLTVPSAGAGKSKTRASAEPGLRPLSVACPHTAVPLCVSASPSPLALRTQSPWMRPHPSHLLLTHLPL